MTVLCYHFKVKENANEEGECGISIDSTWQKRSHASPNGVVSVISLDSKKVSKMARQMTSQNTLLIKR